MWEFENCNFGMVATKQFNDKNPNLVLSMIKSLKQRHDINVFVYKNDIGSIIVKGVKK
ncbi:hypothetical protein [Desulfovibrio sp. TomC]|uniref:hypothetical protein n=1 Tax=Desulfovibrio sp. TomC TaxID=1562888 RepID=UPI0012E1CA39|nr:hypothetical protein [Desulfovibrio sp. TomC]